MISARIVVLIDLRDLVQPQRRGAEGAPLQFSELFILKLAVCEGLEGLALRGIAGFVGVVGVSALGIVVQKRVVRRRKNLPPLPVLPYDQLCVHPAVIPQPAHVDPVGIGFALGTDTAVTGAGAELFLRGGVVFGSVSALDIGHLVQKVAAVIAQRIAADKIIAVEGAHS